MLRQNGYAGLSTRDVAAEAGVPLSQIHYHFGSKQGMMLALFEYLNAQLLDRQQALFGDNSLTLSEQWDRACDYLDEDIASGYVRVLQELIAASWHDADVAKVIRADLMGWVELIVDVARRAERRARRARAVQRRGGRRVRRQRFIGAESLYLLGLEKKGSPVRQVLRRVGDLIRLAEANLIDGGDVMRAKLPDKEGFVDRDGVKLHYEIYGDGAETMLFIPPWSIVHSRIYKAQMPYFSERFRCITYDGAATASPTGRRMSRPIRSTTTSPTRLPSWMRPMPARRSSSGSRSAGSWPACWPRIIPNG